jgi:hypothetical protein
MVLHAKEQNNIYMYILFEAAHSEKSLQCSKIIYICMYNIYKYNKKEKTDQSIILVCEAKWGWNLRQGK